jgi:hypothetical protein
MGDLVWLEALQASVGEEMMTVACDNFMNHQLVVDEVNSAVPRSTSLFHRVHSPLPERVRARRGNVRGALCPAFIRLHPNHWERAPTWNHPPASCQAHVMTADVLYIPAEVPQRPAPAAFLIPVTVTPVTDRPEPVRFLPKSTNDPTQPNHTQP